MLIGCCANNLTEGIAAFPSFSQGGHISHEAKSLICHERWESGTIFGIPSRPSHTTGLFACMPRWHVRGLSRLTPFTSGKKDETRQVFA